jgi:antitoxin HicB
VLNVPVRRIEGVKGTAARFGSDVEQYIGLPYHLSVVRDGEKQGGAWVAAVEELPGCTSRGKTPQDAVGGIEDAIGSWVSAALDEGREVPRPRSPTSHSGRLLLRMPRTLHGELTRVAEREGISLNQFITDVLAAAVGWRHEAMGSTLEGRPKAPNTQEPGAGGLTTELAAPSRGTLRRSTRLVGAALAANFLIVAIVGIVAIIVLIAAWL